MLDVYVYIRTHTGEKPYPMLDDLGAMEDELGVREEDLRVMEDLQ